MSEGEKPKTYEENTKEQYEQLGRFVEAFEMVVDEVRHACVELLSRDGKHWDLIEIALRINVLTAKPLYDILRAVIAAIVNDSIAIQENLKKEIPIVDAEPPYLVDRNGKALKFTPDDRDRFSSVMRAIAEAYTGLANKRNDLLHATWFIGYKSADDPYSSEFYVHKLDVTKKGLKRPSALPKNAKELKELSGRCDETRTWIGHLVECVKGNDLVQDRFQWQGGKLWLVSHAGNKTTLPKK
jgi:hypothetical protein